jgi:thiol-disulfide isomerase/thioredoxin
MKSSRRRLLTAAAGLVSAALPIAANARTEKASPAASRTMPLRGTPVLSDLDGRPVDLSRYLEHPLLLNFWATWCAPCVAEMPALQALRDTSGPRGSAEIEVVAINAGQSINQVEGFLKTLPLRLPIVMDPQKVTLARWQVRVLPTTLLFDAAGLLRATYVGARDWASAAVLEEVRATLLRRAAGRASSASRADS